MVNAQNGRELLDIFWGGLSLTVEDAGNGDFVAPQLLANFFESKTFGGFGFEKGIRLYGKAVAK